MLAVLSLWTGNPFLSIRAFHLSPVQGGHLYGLPAGHNTIPLRECCSSRHLFTLRVRLIVGPAPHSPPERGPNL